MSHVVATTTSLASIVTEIVPGSIQVSALPKPGQDPHHLEIETKHILLAKEAKMFIAVGFDFEASWLGKLLKTSNTNAKVYYAGLKLDGPIAMGTSSHSHHHSRFNPHFLQSPSAILNILPSLSQELQTTYPKQKAEIESRTLQFKTKLQQEDKVWQKQIADLTQKKLIAYHESLEYFAAHYGLEIVSHVEEAHGVGASPLHLKKLLSIIESEKITCVVYESSYSSEALQKIQKLFPKTVKWQKIPNEVGATDTASDYFSWQQETVSSISGCLK